MLRRVTGAVLLVEEHLIVRSLGSEEVACAAEGGGEWMVSVERIRALGRGGEDCGKRDLGYDRDGSSGSHGGVEGVVCVYIVAAVYQRFAYDPESAGLRGCLYRLSSMSVDLYEVRMLKFIQQTEWAVEAVKIAITVLSGEISQPRAVNKDADSTRIKEKVLRASSREQYR